MNRLDRLPRPIKELTAATVDEARVHRIWQGVAGRRTATAGVGLARAIILTTAAVLASALVGAWMLGLFDASNPTGEMAARSLPYRPAVEARPLLLRDGSEPGAVRLPAASGPTTLVFADRSTVVVDPGTSMKPTLNTGRDFTLRLARGRLRLEVKPGGPRRWRVDCDYLRVEVVGTSFTVARDHEGVKVSVFEGKVALSGPDLEPGGRRLAALQQAFIADPAREPAVAEKPVEPEDEPRVASTAGEASDSSWRRYAEQGNHATAFAELGEEGIRTEASEASPHDLMLLADVARLSGHPRQAVKPLEKLLAQHESSPQAPLAAFILGRLELDALSRPARAVDALLKARMLGVPESLEQSVSYRLVQAYARAGRATDARREADYYIERFPNGRFTSLVKEWSTEPE
jgi:transmembrane sensor